MEVIVRSLSSLRKPEKNVRRHTDNQIGEYIRSLEMFGQIKPIIIDEFGEIIAGNGLYEALVKMGRDTCDCCVIPGLTSAQKKKLMLADNRVYELGITDMDAFNEIIRELGGDIDVPGWDADLLEMINASLPEVEEMIENYGVFDQGEIDAVNRRQREAHTTVTESPPPKLVPSEELAPSAQVSRVIICPKCGERICP